MYEIATTAVTRIAEFDAILCVRVPSTVRSVPQERAPTVLYLPNESDAFSDPLFLTIQTLSRLPRYVRDRNEKRPGAFDFRNGKRENLLRYSVRRPGRVACRTKSADGIRRRSTRFGANIMDGFVLPGRFGFYKSSENRIETSGRHC